MSQYALSVTLATFLRARPPPTKIRVTLSIKTFARGSSFPHSRGFDWLVRHSKKHGEREKKLECNGIMSCTRNERDLAAENSNFPSFQHIGISPSPPLPPSPSPLLPSRPVHITNISRSSTLWYFSLFIASRFKSTSVALARHSYTIHATTRREWKKRKWQPWTSSRYSPWVKLWLANNFLLYLGATPRIALQTLAAEKVRSRGDTVTIGRLTLWCCMMAVAFRLADIFSPDVCVFLFLVERRPCFRLFSLAPSLFRSCSLSRSSCYRLIGFPFWLGRHSTRTPECTNNLAKQKRSPMFFYSFHFFRSICRSCPCRWFNRETITRIVHTRIRCTKKERTYFTREML